MEEASEILSDFITFTPSVIVFSKGSRGPFDPTHRVFVKHLLELGGYVPARMGRHAEVVLEARQKAFD
jgi:hypothetical protein